jgi:fructokinase
VNNSINNKTDTIDILCVGEVLIDFIGHRCSYNETRDYHRYLGGSPTNVAMNSTRLGLNATMVAAVGDDGFGSYIFETLGCWCKYKSHYYWIISHKCYFRFEV